MFFAHCYDPTLERQYKGIYVPNCKIDDEINEGYGEKNIMDYLFDKGFITTDKKGNTNFGKEKPTKEPVHVHKKNFRKKNSLNNSLNEKDALMKEKSRFVKKMNKTLFINPHNPQLHTNKLKGQKPKEEGEDKTKDFKQNEMGINFIDLQKRENIRVSVLECMRKFYSKRSTTSSNDPEMAFSKIDIQRLLSGYKEPIIPGFGSVDLFNNPQLRKKTKKIRTADIFRELQAIDKDFKPDIGRETKEKIIQPPMKFTFKEASAGGESVSDMSRISRGKTSFLNPKGTNGRDSKKNKSFFITDNSYYDAAGEYHYKPIPRNPALDPFIERNKSMPKEERVKQSKLLSQFMIQSSKKSDMEESSKS